ncbi:hypothetical protein [Aestuariispira insulae]|uniref:Uncharacterized protein n=1 Tax=Aestuariispira insulae TaxID=1461337 RepID=A0A3D9H3Q9_9PROT|nr:hypothetical protein [Aestuariispira insulae]RED44137.1 hypothetical protein DFP90_11741 [Aestuariispira insulae]
MLYKLITDNIRLFKSTCAGVGAAILVGGSFFLIAYLMSLIQGLSFLKSIGLVFGVAFGFIAFVFVFRAFFSGFEKTDLAYDSITSTGPKFSLGEGGKIKINRKRFRWTGSFIIFGNLLAQSAVLHFQTFSIGIFAISVFLITAGLAMVLLSFWKSKYVE